MKQFPNPIRTSHLAQKQVAVQDKFARKIVQHLDLGTTFLNPWLTSQLCHIREVALRRSPNSVMPRGLRTGAGTSTSPVPEGPIATNRVHEPEG
jgi:hypothetical protein